MRVYEWIFKPGDKEPLHTHPEYVMYCLTSGKVRSYGPDGKVLREREFKAGELFGADPRSI